MTTKTSDNNYTSLFKQVEIKKAPELVFEELQEQILKGKFKAGDKLPSERTLMDTFERSHPTIREALRMLESAGYIEVIPGGGARVRNFEDSMLGMPFKESLMYRRVPAEGVLEFIYATDPIIASMAAKRRTDEEAAKLSSLISTIEEYKDDISTANLKDKVAEIHIYIAEMTHNRLIHIIWKCLLELVDFKAKYSNEDQAHKMMLELVELHRHLSDAIEQGNANAATMNCGFIYDTLTEHMREDTELVIKEPVEKSNPRKASEAIYEQIRNLIFSGELQPGDRLPPERALVEAFGKSRAAVREALKLLEKKDYVTISRGSGTVINNFSTDEMVKILNNMIDANLISVDEIFEMRSISETIGAEWAAARRTQEEIEQMRAALDDWDVNADRTKLVDKGSEFTNAISLASHNETVYIISRLTSELMHNRYSEADIDRAPDEHRAIYEEHLKILKEIEKGNIRGARIATQIHLDTVRVRVLM